MSLLLGPRNYRPNMKWGLLPKNKIDTVTMKPLLNAQETTTVHTQELTSGTTPSGISVTLPLADNNGAANDAAMMQNTRTYGLIPTSHVMGVGNVFLTTIKGSYTAHLSNPPLVVPTATWFLEGETEYLTRGEQTVQDIWESCADVASTAAYIHNHKASDETINNNMSTDTFNRASLKEGLLVNYNQKWVPIYPWIRETTGEWPGGERDTYLNSAYRPKVEDILTRWNPGDGLTPQRTSWSTYGSSDQIIQGPAEIDVPYILDDTEFNSQFIPLKNKKHYFYCKVTKLNSYDFRVDYELPVRYIYVAAARTVRGIFFAEVGRDSYGFKDVISKITIQLNANTQTEETEDLAYSLDADGQLTTDVVNKHPLTFNQNELITKQAQWDDEDWTSAMASHILQLYKNGKYIVECTVTADWALANSLSINTEINVKAQNGEVISRDGSPCLFKVKNIEKVFQGSSFVYNLKLLEV